MSDANPLFRDGRFVETADPDTTNSLAHGGDGQNVMTLDGRVEFTTSPLYGDFRDNVWTIQGVRTYTGTEVPTRDDDAFLIPGHPHRTAVHANANGR